MLSDIQLSFQLLPPQIGNTLYMVFVSAFFAGIIGFPLGIWLTVTSPGHLKPNVWTYKILDFAVNTGRSFPFAILIVALIPFTRFLIGTSLGTTAAIIPLTIAAIPFVARMSEEALRSVDFNLIEAALMMGSTTLQIVRKVLIREALPSIISGFTLTVVNLIGYSAMAGLVGGGGLGQVAIQYGYNRFNLFIMTVTVVLLIIIVQCVQWGGKALAASVLKKRGISSHE